MKGNNYSEEEKFTVKSKRKEGKSEKFQSKSVTQIMNGEFLTKDFVMNNLGYIFFVFFLLILLVSKGYYANQMAKEISKERKELNNITSDYVTNKAELERLTTRVQLIKKLEDLGLKETVNPTKVIRIKNTEEK